MLQMCWGMRQLKVGSDMKPTGLYFDENGKPYLVANPSKKKRKKALKKFKKLFTINNTETQIFIVRDGKSVIIHRCSVVDFQMEI